MKIDGYRLLHSQDAHPLKMQTYVATFATDEEEDRLEIFGVKIADIPKRPNAIQGGPGLISCKLTLMLDMKKELIAFERLEFGVDVYGENPTAEADGEKLAHWLPMKKIAFRKYEIDEAAVPEGYPRNHIADALKQAMFKAAR